MYPWKRGLRRLGAAEAPGPAAMLPPPADVALPLLWGESALVRPGDHVYLGQRVADGSGDTVPLHASVSGRVAAVAPRACAGGERCMAVVLESDGAMEPDPALRPQPLLDGLSDALLTTLLFESGVRLPGGLPLAAAVADAGPGVQTLILSAMDLEPTLCAENAALRFETEDVLSGLHVLERLTRPLRMVLAVPAGQKEAVRTARRWTGPRLQLACGPDIYPSAHPWQLARRIGGLAPGETARSSGVLVVPVSAAAAAGRSVYGGMPVVRQTVCVAWEQGRTLVSAPLGTSLETVLAAAEPGPGETLLGGPMTGRALERAAVPLVKGMDGLTRLPSQKRRRQTACIRCGRCEAVCPAGLQPWRSQRRGEARAFAGCIRCGACQFSCPAGRPLLRSMERQGKEAAGVG